MNRRPPKSTLFPYTSLFRSPGHGAHARAQLRIVGAVGAAAHRERAGQQGGDGQGAAHRGAGLAFGLVRESAKGLVHGLLPCVLSMVRSEEHTSVLQSPCNLVCRLLLEKKKKVILTSHVYMV